MSTEHDGLCSSSATPSSSRLTVTVPAGAIDYDMDHPKRGTCLILNYMEFSVAKLETRSGTDRDRDALERTFRRLGFDVKVPRNDLTRRKTLRVIEQVATQDHSDSDCVAVCVLTHGRAGGVLYASDDFFYYEDIFRLFTPDKSPTLSGKPKLFFFQACQGNAIDLGVRLRLEGGSNSMSPFYEYKIPLQADFFAAYATVPGYVAHRNGGTGSCFIQSLVHELDANWECLDLASIMTLVCRKVAIEYESFPMKEKQAPFWTSSLMRFVRFSKQLGNNNNNIINSNNINSNNHSHNNGNGFANGAAVPTLVDNSESEDFGEPVDGTINDGGSREDNNVPFDNPSEPSDDTSVVLGDKS